MEILLKINNKDIPKVNTTILHTSKSNYNVDMLEFINNNCEVIVKTSRTDINDIPLKILDSYNCLELTDKKELTNTDEVKINILKSLCSDKEVIVFYDILNYIDNKMKGKLMKELIKQDKIIINYTTEIEETLYLDYLIIVHENKVIMEGQTKEVLNEEKIIKKLGFNMPLITELSSGLKYYSVVNKKYYDIESLVEDLWK
ncbi:MAG: hypothetical protein HFI49_01135 [Bacilli bacterium]|jgi:ABC-type cobalamin/Fe3+-siderophores transport system ATPase subunit|nr:hypothetical protein [Bacilli bacterium]